MDLCVVNWDVVSKIAPAFFASCTALYIYRGWNKQKRSEVIAVESQNTIKDLLETLTLISDLVYNTSNNRERIPLIFDKYKNLTHQTMRNLLYLDKCLHEKKLEEISNSYFESVYKITSKLEEICTINNSYISSFDESILQKNLDSNATYLEQIVDILRPYSTYQKRI